MKGFILTFVCILCFSVSGCMNTVRNAPVVVATGTTAYIEHDIVVEIIRMNLDIFSPRELSRLTKANDRICVVKNEIKVIREKRGGDVSRLVTDLPRLLPLYSEAKEAYLVAHGIVMNRIDEFSVIDRRALMSYSDTCTRLDIAIQEAMISSDGTDNTQLVKDIMTFAFLVGKIVLPMFVVI